MKFLSWAAGRNIIDLNFLNNEGSVVTIVLILFSKNKPYSIFKNKLFLENSLFFENRIKTMVKSLPSLLRKLKSIMFLPAAQDKFQKIKTFSQKTVFF